MAARRAVWTRLNPFASVMSRATRLYCRMTFADQDLAMFVSSAARMVLVAPPQVFTSLYAVTQSELDSAGGGPGRNWEPLVRMKGRTFAAHGVCGAANGDVRRYTPGPGVSVGNVNVEAIGVCRPSPVRARMTWLAATQPILWPASFAWPLGIAASAVAYNGSSVGAAVGK